MQNSQNQLIENEEIRYFQNQESDDSLNEEDFGNSTLAKSYDEIIDEMESFKEGLSRKIKKFSENRRSLLMEIQKLDKLKQEKESYITGLEGRENKLLDESKELKAQKLEFKNTI